MPIAFEPNSKKYDKKFDSQAFHHFIKPISAILPETPVLESRGDRPLQMTFEDQLKALIFFHLEEHSSARHLVQVLNEDDFARKNIAPTCGIKKSSFSEAINGRGLEQLQYVFSELYSQASDNLPSQYDHLGQLVALDGSLIDAVLSMTWADYRKGSKKAKVHVGFNINQGIPMKIHLTEGKGAERPFLSQTISRGQTGIADRGYQEHALFDSLQADGKSFVIRIKVNTTRTFIQKYDINPDSIVFCDAEALLGTVENKNQTQTPVRLVGYCINGTDYWVATDRRDLTAEQIAEIYKLRWDIETFFAWWKRHLRVYHLIARSKHGLMVQILAGLITYLLLAIYCHREYGEKVNIKRVRELRIQIQNELRQSNRPDN
ncbi:MAG: IS4 family transposase, partial [Desulfobacteraceae bacterium]|nr:IS4 family transposase [Desulfobacteraceae bacterium]